MTWWEWKSSIHFENIWKIDFLQVLKRFSFAIFRRCSRLSIWKDPKNHGRNRDLESCENKKFPRMHLPKFFHEIRFSMCSWSKWRFFRSYYLISVHCFSEHLMRKCFSSAKPLAMNWYLISNLNFRLILLSTFNIYWFFLECYHKNYFFLSFFLLVFQYILFTSAILLHSTHVIGIWSFAVVAVVCRQSIFDILIWSV